MAGDCEPDLNIEHLRCAVIGRIQGLMGDQYLLNSETAGEIVYLSDDGCLVITNSSCPQFYAIFSKPGTKCIKYVAGSIDKEQNIVNPCFAWTEDRFPEFWMCEIIGRSPIPRDFNHVSACFRLRHICELL